MGTESRLTDLHVKNAKPGDKLSDGGGLHLLVKSNGTKLWQYRFKQLDRENTHSIGIYHPTDLPLREARLRRNAARELVRQGRNPNEARKEERRLAAQAELLKRKNTFRAAYDDWIESTYRGLDPKTVGQRKREIEQYAQSLLPMPLKEITRMCIVDVLKPIELKVPEVARNVRQYISAIFEMAIDSGLLTSNPTPTRSKIKRDKPLNHPALIGEDVVDFLGALATDDSSELKTKIATELLLLTACRKAEVTRAKWGEFDFKGGHWEIPEERMKGRLPHWVPLSKQAVNLLIQWKNLSADSTEYVFSNRRDSKRPMAGGSLNALMNRLGFQGKGTPHGHRSSFSTHFNRKGSNADAIERCLAHVHQNSSRAAYNRYEYADERRKMLQEWADHLENMGAKFTHRVNSESESESCP